MKKALVFITVLLTALFFSKASFAQVGLYEVFEASFTSTGSYTNPYLQASMTTTFTGPSGQTITVNGFWDGGNTWKVRFAPTAIGTWAYTTSSADPGPNGKTGSFEAVASSNKGHIRVSKTYPYSFEYSDGTPFFWLGDTNWDWDNLSTPFNGTFQNYADTRANQGFTIIQGTLGPTGAGGRGAPRYSGENEGGGMFVNYDISGEKLNPAHFQWMDKRVQYIMSKNLSLAFWFVWADDWGNGMNGDTYRRYARYLIARYSAYNVMWGVMGEYEEIGNAAAVRDAGNYIKVQDPYKHPLTTHTINATTDDFGSDSWIDFHGQQQWTNWSTKNSLILNDRRYNKPVVNMEYGYENEGYSADDVRKAHWGITMAGGFGVYGERTIAWDKPVSNWNTTLNLAGASQMKHLKTFIDKTRWWEMTPSNNLVSTGYAIVNSGQEYIVYLPNGGSVNVNLSSASGSFTAEWFNPRTGVTNSAGTVNGGTTRSFTAPDTNDWALHIYRGITDTTPPSTPADLTAAPQSESQINLSWAASTDPESGILRYNIYRNNTLVGNSSNTAFSDTGLSEGTTYTYQVSAVNGASLESAKSSSVSATTKADTTAPTIVLVSAAGDATKVMVVFSEPVEQTSATAISNYSINNGITISSVSLGADLKTVTLTTSVHQENVTYTLTVSNIKDRATTPNTIVPNTQATYTFVAKLIISNLTVTSGDVYEVASAPISDGALAYIDRSFTYRNVPGFMVGEASYIKTANSDKLSQTDNFLSFDVNQSVAVYIAHDDRYITKPTWLSGFTNTGTKLNIDSLILTLFTKGFPAGRIALGGNTPDGSGDNNMYTVLIMSKGITYPTGDVNKDSSIDILDVQALVNHILGIQDYGASADVNTDGSVDVLDVQEVVNIILGG